MMPTYTVQDGVTGKNVTFDWSGDQPPTENDMHEVFQAAGVQTQPQAPTIPVAKPEGFLGSIPQFVAGTAGSVAAKTLGGPIGMGAVGLTQAGGEALKEIGQDIQGLLNGSPSQAPATSSERAKAILNAFGSGVLGEGAGRALGPAVSWIAGKLGPKFAAVAGLPSGSDAGDLGAIFNSAAKGSDEAAQFLRGNKNGADLLEMANNAVSSLKADRAAEYQAGLQKLSESGAQVDITPIKNALASQMEKYGIKIGPDGAYDFSRSTLDKTAQGGISDIIDLVNTWGTKPGDNTPLMLDTLKRKIADHFSPSNNGKTFVSALGNSVKKTITDAVPEYGEMTSKYAQATDVLDQIQKELSLNPNAADQTAIKKLRSIFGERNEYRNQLVQKMAEASGRDIPGAVAGLNQNQWVPRGLQKRLATLTGYEGLGELGAYMGGKQLNPWALITGAAAVPSMIPRVAGEAANLAGNVARIAPAAQQSSMLARALLQSRMQQ